MNEMQAETLLCELLVLDGWKATRQFGIGGKLVDVVGLAANENVAVEIKLKDLKRGASQAFVNQGFFDRSYLAVPRSCAVRALHHSRGLGIGVIVFDENSFEILAESDLNPIADAISVSIRRRAFETLAAVSGR
jgi:hypothetical protein